MPSMMRLPTHPKIWLFALVGSALAVGSIVDAAGNVYRARQPQIAARLPGETQAQVNLLRKASSNLGGAAFLPANAFPVARRALWAEPLNTKALHILAFASDPKGTSSAAVKYATLANRVSRRDLPAQLVLIDASARSGRTAAALKHLDAALRTRMSSRPLIFPILKRALESASIRKDLAVYLVRRTPWTLEFVSYAMDDPVAAPRIADVILRVGNRMERDDLVLVAPPLITRLVEANEMAPVPDLLALLSREEAGQLLETADFTAASTSQKYGAAAWRIRSDATISSTFLTGRNGEPPVLSVYAAPGANGVVADKVLVLASGRYAIRQKIFLEQPASAGQLAQWRLTCLTKYGNRPAGRSANILEQKPGSGLTVLEIPENCPSQRLELITQVPFGQAGLDVSIGQFHLARI